MSRDGSRSLLTLVARRVTRRVEVSADRARGDGDSLDQFAARTRTIDLKAADDELVIDDREETSRVVELDPAHR